MTLHRKIVVLLLAGISLYTIVGYLFHQYLILPSFVSLEEEEARKDMRRCREALESQIDRIDLLCFDWAAWDDTYAFIEEASEAYKESNLIPESFMDNGISFMYFIRSDGTLVWGRFYDLETESPVPFPDFEHPSWPPDHPLLRHEERESSIHGVIASSRGPLLISSRPILPSEASDGDHVRGTVLMGRILDETVVEKIRSRTEVAVSLLTLPNAGWPVDPGDPSGEKIRVERDDASRLRVFSNVLDVFGEDLLLFVVDIPRTIVARGQSAIRWNMAAVAVAGVFFVAMMLLSLKWVVTDPLERLSSHAGEVGLLADLRPLALGSRTDEIGVVAREFNSMIERLRREEADLLAAEAALRRSEARLKTILDTAPDTILTLDTEGRIESANGAAATQFGYAADELVRMNARDLLAPARRDAWESFFEQYRARSSGPQSVFDAELEGIRANGEQFSIHVSASGVDLESTRHFICDIRDISSLKVMQEKVARSQHLASLGEMGASVAHEIRNPLAGIKGALQILSGGGLSPEERAEVLESIDGLVERIEHTVVELLRYAKPLSPKRELVNAYELIASVSTPLPEGAQLDINCPSGLMLAVDPRLFRHVLENLWRNACQALRAPWRLHWTVQEAHHEVILALFNDGAPVAPENLAHAFDPFFTTRVEGTGLGLPVSLRIVEAHNGTMKLENVGERGVQVSIRLPQGE